MIHENRLKFLPESDKILGKEIVINSQEGDYNFILEKLKGVDSENVDYETYNFIVDMVVEGVNSYLDSKAKTSNILDFLKEVGKVSTDLELFLETQTYDDKFNDTELNFGNAVIAKNLEYLGNKHWLYFVFENSEKLDQVLSSVSPLRIKEQFKKYLNVSKEELKNDSTYQLFKTFEKNLKICHEFMTYDIAFKKLNEVVSKNYKNEEFVEYAFKMATPYLFEIISNRMTKNSSERRKKIQNDILNNLYNIEEKLDNSLEKMEFIEFKKTCLGVYGQFK